MIEFRQILCPVDFSESSARSLAHAAALARWYEAQLTVLHVVPTFDPVQVRGECGVPVQFVNPVTREDVLGEMRQLLERAGASPEAPLIAQTGDASAGRIARSFERPKHIRPI